MPTARQQQRDGYPYMEMMPSRGIDVHTPAAAKPFAPQGENAKHCVLNHGRYLDTWPIVKFEVCFQMCTIHDMPGDEQSRWQYGGQRETVT